MALTDTKTGAASPSNAVSDAQRRRTPFPRRALLLAAASGVLQVLVFPSADLSFLCWVCVAPLLLAIFQAGQFDGPGRPVTPWRGFVLGYVTGLIWSFGACYWIYDVMHIYGGLDRSVATGVLVLFSLTMALSWAVFGWVMALLARGRLGQKAVLLAPFVWVATEMLRGFPFDFRWDPLGTALVNNIPLTRLATVTGVYGLSFEILALNVAFAVAFLVDTRRRRSLLAAAILATLMLQAGTLLKPAKLPSNGTARLVQSNIPILTGEQWTQQYFDQTVKALADLSIPKPGEVNPNQPPIDLIVWPESPAPFFINDPNFRHAVAEVARQAHAAVVVGSIGLPTPAQGQEVYNSAAIVAPDGSWGARYDKVHLVPFGEYVPFKQLLGFAGSLTHEVGDFIPGAQHNVLRAGDLAVGTFICYESVFPGEVREFAKNGAQVFVNVSNDGWFGDTAAPWQHLEQARMRAIEDHRWLLRSTNTGITGVIDPFGRVLDTAPRNQRTYIDVPFSVETNTTFYARHGNWFWWVCAIISVLAIVGRFALPTAPEIGNR